MVTINGVDLASLGFMARSRLLPRLPRARATIVEISGGDPVLIGSAREPDTLSIVGTIKAATHALLLASIDTLAALLAGECVIRFSDITDREWVGTLHVNSEIRSLQAAAWINTIESVSLTFHVPAPARAQALTTITGIAPGTYTPLTLGTAPSRLNVTVQNNAGGTLTSVGISILTGGAGSDGLRVLGWSGSVPANGAFVVTTDPAFEVTVDGANAVDGLDETADFPVADPAEGAATIWTTKLGAGTPVIAVSYYRRWW